jgi:DNA-binding LacI/PurR family transcriptional regulator
MPARLFYPVPRPVRTETLNAVATAARVSAMTVSRVLRNAPHVSATTRERVLRAARKLGYQPNPQITRLMSIVRSSKGRRVQGSIGVIRDDIPEDELHDRAYQYVSVEDIRRRAERHGYRAEEFFLGRNGLTTERLNAILLARGIEGIIVSPQSSLHIGARLNFSPFAAATFGYGLQFPALHRASTNMMHGILNAADQLEQRGYRRIGIAITQWVDARADHTYSGALLHYQQRIATRDRVPLLIVPDNLAKGAGTFRAWFEQHRPDVLISFDTYVPDWLSGQLGLRIPEDVGLVVHDWTERMVGFAGIDHRRSHVAAAAVDLVATQLMQNEHGIPEVPRQILIPPAWVDGASILPLPGPPD